ncbi:hypothetical protein BpHYR1_032205 [Brachionus plicatilis]|uniref:Uncharacterized protein n=1 Tax=Brachionus plicatilis TaxID=10195 RepID=A0A3M7Q625_BRAPC|nr:hypothetical protein BpHYR1_032205 [Brachionus plicatilis]
MQNRNYFQMNIKLNQMDENFCFCQLYHLKCLIFIFSSKYLIIMFRITSKSSNDLNKSYKKTYRCDLIKLVEKAARIFLAVYFGGLKIRPPSWPAKWPQKTVRHD